MAQPQTASIVLAAANAVAVAASQTPGGAGAMTLTSGTVTLDTARRVLVTTAGADVGKTITITGTDRNRNAQIETVTLVSAGTVSTLQDFLTVTKAVISAGAAGAITIGTSGVASTRWLRINHRITPTSFGIAVNLGTATASVTVEATLDPVERTLVEEAPDNTGSGDMSVAGLPNSAFRIPTVFPVSGMSALTADTVQGVTTPVMAFRLTVNSGATTAGTRITLIQAGV